MMPYTIRVQGRYTESLNKHYDAPDKGYAVAMGITQIAQHLLDHDELTEAEILATLIRAIPLILRARYWICPLHDVEILIEENPQED